MVNGANSVTETLIANCIEEIQDNIGFNIKTSMKRKIFTTLIELIQNINFYTHSVQGVDNYCTFRQYTDHFEIEGCNVIQTQDQEILVKELGNLANLENSEVSNLLFSTLDNNVPAKSNKNGLGLICIFNNCKEVKYDFTPINSNFYKYKIKVKI